MHCHKLVLRIYIASVISYISYTYLISVSRSQGFLNGIKLPVFTDINYSGSYYLKSEKRFSDLLRS